MDFEKIQNFVEEQRWKYPFELKRTTTLEKDLKITGDDADEFIHSFGEKFDVDVTNFDISEYFEPEGDKILPAMIRFLTGQKKQKLKELSLGDLELAIKVRKLESSVLP